MNASIRQFGLGYSLPGSGGVLPVCPFMWERRHDTKTPFVGDKRGL